jgi:hypothetical protein
MANFRILPVNIVDLATVTDSPAMLATLPVTNVARQTEREKTARTTALASQDVKLTWAANRRSNMMAVTRHNLTRPARSAAWATRTPPGRPGSSTPARSRHSTPRAWIRCATTTPRATSRA